MRMNMNEIDAAAFDKFIEKHWGNQLNRKETVQVSATVEEKPKRRGRKPKTEV